MAASSGGAAMAGKEAMSVSGSRDAGLEQRRREGEGGGVGGRELGADKEREEREEKVKKEKK